MRIIPIVSLLALSVALSGCDGAEEAEPETTAGTEAEQMAQEEAKATETEERAAEQQTEQMAQNVAQLSVRSKEPYGQYLADQSGMALYMFTADTQGEKSACSDDCAAAWPPYFTTGEPMAGDEAVKADQLGTLQREDGTMQVTYNGWPLYYFVRDDAAGATNGQDVEGFGGEWYLVGPDGEAIKTEEEEGGQ